VYVSTGADLADPVSSRSEANRIICWVVIGKASKPFFAPVVAGPLGAAWMASAFAKCVQTSAPTGSTPPSAVPCIDRLVWAADPLLGV
jgi:hypothetical protein